MLNKKLIIGFIIALIALIVVGFVALNFVPHNDILDLNLTLLSIPTVKPFPIRKLFLKLL